jgi:hypothetical protein
MEEAVRELRHESPLSKIFIRSRSATLIHKYPSIGPPFRVRILEGFSI